MIFSQIKQRYQNWEAKKLFRFYIVMNMIPSICLVFTEPYDFIGKFLLVFFPLGLYFFLLSLSRNTGLMQLIFFPVLFLHAFQLVLFYLFGESVIAVDMFLNLVTTNVSEASELLDNIWPAVVFVCLLYIPTTIIAGIACKRKIRITDSFRKKMLIAGAIIMLLSYGLTFIAHDKNTGKFSLAKEIYPVDVLYNLGFAIQKWHRSEQYPATSANFVYQARKDVHTPNREVYVLVIGEASRADNWSLGGYERKTTPQLAQTPGVVYYPDALTQSNTTHKSVPMILSSASAANYEVIYTRKSILEAFKEAGFTTVFLSNQTPNRSFTDFFAEQANYHHNIRVDRGGTLISKNRFDAALLPIFQHYLDSVPGNLFVVLHTYGSHFNYKERYPENFGKFKPDNATDVKKENKEQLINAYDNSILYTDDFLHQIIELLQQSNTCSALYYTSDHGEDLLDDKRNRFLHSSPRPTYYQLHIPMFMWFSGNYQTAYPQKAEAAVANKPMPVSTNAVFHTLLDMASIHMPYFQSEFSLVNPDFKINRRMYLNDHDKPVFFYNAGLKKEDKEMIEKKKIYHE